MSFNYKMYFQYLSNVDESPATQGGKENYWRKLTLDGTYLKVQKYFFGIWGAIMVMIVWYLDLQLPMKSVPITTNVMSLNPVHSKVYSIQHYVIKFVSDLQQVSSTNKTDRHDITEILLKVAYKPP